MAFSIIFIIAEPTTQPSEKLLSFFICSWLSIPKPTNTGSVYSFFIEITDFLTELILGFLVPVIPITDT